MPQYLADQLAILEEQREQLGEDMYRQIKQGMEETGRLGDAMLASARRLPEPTSAEQAALDRYRDELMALMMADDEDMGGGDGSWSDEDYEDEEDYEDGESYE